MAWSFRRRIKIAPGVNLNLSKSGISTSVGPKGAKMTFGPNGTYLHTGIPGTGIYSRRKISSSGDSIPNNPSSDNQSRSGCLSVVLLIAAVVFLIMFVQSVLDLGKQKKMVNEQMEHTEVSKSVSSDSKETNIPAAADISSIEVDESSSITNDSVSNNETEKNKGFSIILFAFLSFCCLYALRKEFVKSGLNVLALFSPLFCRRNKKSKECGLSFEETIELAKREKNTLKKQIIENRLGHLLMNDVDGILKPKVDKLQKSFEKKPSQERKDALTDASKEYETAKSKAESLIYSFDNTLSESIKERYTAFCEAFNAFKQSKRVWRILSSTRNTERKSSAGTTIQKSPIDLGSSTFDFLSQKDPVPVFPSSQGDFYYFYPSFVIKGKSISDFSVVPIDKVSLLYRPTRFVETGFVPTDSRKVNTTYRYVNKDGGPDLRYSNNPSFPVLLYGDITILPFGEKFQVSNNDAAMSLEQAFSALKDACINEREKKGNEVVESRDDETESGLAQSPRGNLTEQYFVDIVDAAKRLIEFSNKLAEDKAFCRVVKESVSGRINWNGNIVDNPAEKIPIYLWADVIHNYQSLGHKFDLSSNEGLGILVFNTLFTEPSFQFDFQYLDFYIKSLQSASEEFINKTIPSMSKIDEVSLLEMCLRDYDRRIHNQFVVLLYRFVALIAKADKSISSTEADWLNKIMSLKEPENVDDVLTPSDSVKKSKGKDTIKKSGNTATKELNSLIGLTSVKTEINTLTNYINIQRMRAEKGMKVSPISYHCVFTGNPGTGKTTVARIVSEIYKELGILKKGHLVETDRSGLVAEYVGQTAVKTNKIIDSALDGILFIDEAYSLVDGGNSDYGKEAIATLLKRMEDDRARLVVILAGYTGEMKRFIDSNPGLQSRFNRYIEFPDYSAEELFLIFESSTDKYEYKLTDEAGSALKDAFEKAVAKKDKSFGNGRFVRNLFEKVIENQANRISSSTDISAESLATIEIDDIMKSI